MCLKKKISIPKSNIEFLFFQRFPFREYRYTRIFVFKENEWEESFDFLFHFGFRKIESFVIRVEASTNRYLRDSKIPSTRNRLQRSPPY